jgi:FkbM family methyltransferase
MNTLVRIIRRAVRRAGYDMIHYTPWKNLFDTLGLDLILDVGANVGQSYDSFRWAGFKGPIYSFEPNPEIFKRLQQQPGYNWQRFSLALSSRSARATFHLTNSDNSNSLQVPLVGVKVVGEITVPAIRLDEFWIQNKVTARNAFLKIDTEGHDWEVVRGASGVLDKIQLIMVEAAPLPRYQGEPDFSTVVDSMGQLGFRVCRVEKNSTNIAAGIDTALDVVFARQAFLAKAQSAID